MNLLTFWLPFIGACVAVCWVLYNIRGGWLHRHSAKVAPQVGQVWKGRAGTFRVSYADNNFIGWYEHSFFETPIFNGVSVDKWEDFVNKNHMYIKGYVV